MEEKGALPDESWMNGLEEAAATAFLGMLSLPLVKSLFSLVLHPQLRRKRCVTLCTGSVNLMIAWKQSNSVLMTFFLLMMVNRGVQEKAQAQIDAVVGSARLPTADDRTLLPYVDAIFCEILRFSPSAPLCE